MSRFTRPRPNICLLDVRLGLAKYVWIGKHLYSRVKATINYAKI